MSEELVADLSVTTPENTFTRHTQREIQATHAEDMCVHTITRVQYKSMIPLFHLGIKLYVKQQ